MPTRRTVLKGAGFTVAGALVGCSGPDSGELNPPVTTAETIDTPSEVIEGLPNKGRSRSNEIELQPAEPGLAELRTTKSIDEALAETTIVKRQPVSSPEVSISDPDNETKHVFSKLNPDVTLGLRLDGEARILSFQLRSDDEIGDYILITSSIIGIGDSSAQKRPAINTPDGFVDELVVPVADIAESRSEQFMIDPINVQQNVLAVDGTPHVVGYLGVLDVDADGQAFIVAAGPDRS
ncbi:hypothetical protein KA529_04420 [Candidatus Saccharibacteria bacterium]|nr:hypothetical protein [Candidatus Saccharibacteria bacterium]